ncbi:Arf GTPase arl1 [Apophysomyces ossiformis]|uniref:Arf GTPase arl1 n=1 Tax=Apophysomyces ossiformis TaxID=679940 RepID=A0A8H7BXM1_9FUNG|nr:Arf GTPase arl1 [Apophysomyces ossiformis]
MKRFSGMFTQLWANKTSHPTDEEGHIPVRILGARGSGKTTFLYKLYFKHCAGQPDEVFDVLPTESHNVEVIPFRRFSFEIWEFSEISAALNYMNNTKVLIYFLDAVAQNDVAVADKARENLLWVLQRFSKQLEDAIVVTVVNKTDAPGALDVQDIGQLWVKDHALRQALQGHHWRIFPCSALSGQVDEVLDYVFQKLDFREATAKHSHSSISLPSSTSLSTITARSARRSGSLRRQSLEFSDDNSSSNRTSEQHKKYLRDFHPQAKMPVTPWEEVPNPYHLSDHEFQSWFNHGKSLLFFDHYSLLRIAYLTIRDEGGGHTKRLLYNLRTILRGIELMEQDTLREASLRRPQELIHQSIEYSETQTLFWIQMVSFALLRHPVLEGEDNGFEAFLMRCPELWDNEIWKTYYSPKIYHSEKAATEFIPPDKKPLPNAFKSSALALKGSGLRIDYQVL